MISYYFNSLELPTQAELCCHPRSNWVKFDLFLILSSMLDIALKQVATVSEVLHLDTIRRSFGQFGHLARCET